MIILELKNKKGIIYYKNTQEDFLIDYYETKVHISDVDKEYAKQIDNDVLYQKFNSEFVFETYQDSLIFLDNSGTRIKFIKDE